MINCIIVDDEPLARDMIRLHLSSFPGWHIVQECMNALEAYEALLENKVQVMFLDIQMPKIKGNDFLRSLKSPPLVVFTTAYADFAVEGFELNVFDYLLKPVTPERFRQCVEKVESFLFTDRAENIDVQQPAAMPDQTNNYLFIRQDNKLVKVMYDDILFLEARRDFTKIYLKDRSILTGYHLKMMEEMLPASQFLRVHRSYMIAVKAVTAVYGNTVEINSFQVPVGANYKETLHTALKI